MPLIRQQMACTLALALLGCASADTPSPTAAIGTATAVEASVTDDAVRQSYREHAALAQLHRWWLFYENERTPIDLQRDLVSPDVTIETPRGVATGVEDYVARALETPRTWKNAHEATTLQVELLPDGGARIVADVTYLNKGSDPSGAVAGALLTYDMRLAAPMADLPQIASVTIKREGAAPEGPFIDTYARNRAASLVHAWMSFVESPDRATAPFDDILAPSFTLNFSSGPISDPTALRAWLAGPASAVAASRHVVSPILVEGISADRYQVAFNVDWQGLAKDGGRMTARTAHTWLIQDDPTERFARIERIDVNVLEPFAPVPR